MRPFFENKTALNSGSSKLWFGPNKKPDDPKCGIFYKYKKEKGFVKWFDNLSKEGMLSLDESSGVFFTLDPLYFGKLGRDLNYIDNAAIEAEIELESQGQASRIRFLKGQELDDYMSDYLVKEFDDIFSWESVMVEQFLDMRLNDTLNKCWVNRFFNETEGNVLWVDKRDKNGIIITDYGQEIYFDISVCKNRVLPEEKQKVNFLTKIVGGTPCAYDVKAYND